MEGKERTRKSLKSSRAVLEIIRRERQSDYVKGEDGEGIRRWDVHKKVWWGRRSESRWQGKKSGKERGNVGMRDTLPDHL